MMNPFVLCCSLLVAVAEHTTTALAKLAHLQLRLQACRQAFRRRTHHKAALSASSRTPNQRDQHNPHQAKKATAAVPCVRTAAGLLALTTPAAAAAIGSSGPATL